MKVSMLKEKKLEWEEKYKNENFIRLNIAEGKTTFFKSVED